MNCLNEDPGSTRHLLAHYPPEDSRDDRYIVWAVPADSAVAHPVFEPAAGRMVDPECGPVFFASSMFGKKPIGLEACKICHKAMFGERTPLDERP